MRRRAYDSGRWRRAVPFCFLELFGGVFFDWPIEGNPHIVLAGGCWEAGMELAVGISVEGNLREIKSKMN